jgi:hypothetical protein
MCLSLTIVQQKIDGTVRARGEIRMDCKPLEIYTGRFVRIFALQLYTFFWSVCIRIVSSARGISYQTACCAVVCALASHLEGNIVGSGVLELDSRCRQVLAWCQLDP